jgi:hypothetical protein
MKRISELSQPEFEALLREGVALSDAPRALRQNAVALMRTQRATSPAQLLARVGEALSTQAKKFHAVLSFDSWKVSPAAAGLRSGLSETRQMLFTTPGRDFDVRVTAVDGKFVLGGQILGDFGSGSVSLSINTKDGGQPHFSLGVELDSYGSFRLGPYPEGSARLAFRLDDDQIELPEIEMRKRG